MAKKITDKRPPLTSPLLGGYAAKQCARRLHNDYDPTIDNAQKVPETQAQQMRMEEGNDFEAAVERRLKALLDPAEAVFLEGDRSGASLDKREQATAEAMQKGVPFIWNPRLTPQREAFRTGEPDALVRVGRTRARNRKWRYGGVDVKHHHPMQGTAAARPWKVSDLATPWPDQGHELDQTGIPQLVDSMQLAHYHRMLERLGAAGPAIGGIIGKELDGTLVVLWRDLDSALYQHDDENGVRRKMSPLEIYDLEFAFRVEVAERALARGADETLVALAPPEWKGECKECPWREVCHDDLRELDHITLLQGVTPARAKAHYATGVTTVAELARLDWRTAAIVDTHVDLPALMAAADVVEDTSAPLRTLVTGKNATERAALAAFAAGGVRTISDLTALDTRTARYAGTGVANLAASIDQARVAKADRVHRARGVDHVRIPRAAVELDVDMENDDQIYLWGVYLTVRSRGVTREEYHPFVSFDGTDEGEANTFVEFWSYLLRMQAWARNTKVGGFKAFYYTQAETRCLRALAEKHAGRPGVPTSAELETFIASDDWVDMYEIIAAQTLWPTEDLSIKSVAKRCGFTWRDADAGGGNSVSWYRDAVYGATPELREESQAHVLRYNEDDVLATRYVRDWLSRLGAARRPGDKLPSVADLDQRFRRRPVPVRYPVGDRAA